MFWFQIWIQPKKLDKKHLTSSLSNFFQILLRCIFEYIMSVYNFWSREHQIGISWTYICQYATTSLNDYNIPIFDNKIWIKLEIESTIWKCPVHHIWLVRPSYNSWPCKYLYIVRMFNCLIFKQIWTLIWTYEQYVSCWTSFSDKFKTLLFNFLKKLVYPSVRHKKLRRYL